MKLILIRHGQSIGNTKPGFISGKTDSEGLTGKGKIQIIRSAYELRKEKIEKIYTSPVVRARETAEILMSVLGKAPVVVDWLSELDHGVFEGSYWWETIHKIPPMWHLRREDFTSAYPGGGESMQMLVNRLWAGLENFTKTHDHRKAYLLVSHQAVISALRYILEFGDPKKLDTKQKQKKFTDFMHSQKPGNGTYYTVELKPKNSNRFIQTQDFKPVMHNTNSVRFYAKAYFRDATIKVTKVKTASSNFDYHLENAKDYLLKLIKSKDLQVVQKQIALYQYLHEKEIRTCAILAHDSSKMFFKQEVIIQDYILGIDQNHCLVKHTSDINTVFHELFQELEKIYNLPVGEVKIFWLPPVEEQFQKWVPFMIYNINYTIYMIDSLGLDDDIKTKIKERLLELKKYILAKKYELVPIHGDLSSENIIIKHDKVCKLARIVDFEWARIGDRLWDIAYYWGWLERADKSTAKKWAQFIAKKLSSKELKAATLYKVLFHAWTVRDMLEYKDDPLRLKRGKRSREILKHVNPLTH